MINNARIKKLSIKQEKKRQALLESAIKVFSEKGFHEARISEIAHEAGVADGTTYLYFKNKDDLLIKAVEDLFERKLQEMERHISQEKTGRDKLLRFAEEHITIFTEDPKVVRFLGVELRQSKEFYKKYPDFKPLRHYMKFLQEICEEAIAEGSIRAIDSKALSYIVYGTVNFVITEWAVQEQSFSLTEVKNYVEDILRYGLIVRKEE
ncbi:MAG: TetR/AcrR family transcriptional regulator [Candidatus Cloacimonetes bacterium]|nr:TetR/AcrR family transcriptional regulator [Candidatus Cloacimonadota bacterium]